MSADNKMLDQNYLNTCLPFNFIDVISQNKSSYGDRTAVEGVGYSITYFQLDVLIENYAKFLLDNSVRQGECIGLHIADELVCLLTLLASVRIGSVVFSFPVTEPIESKKDEIATLAISKVFTDGSEPIASLVNVRISRAVHRYSSSMELPTYRGLNTPWLVFSSSGSTGKPKLLLLTHTHFYERMKSNNESIGLTHLDRVAMMSSLDFATPKQRYLEALSAGATVVLLDRRAALNSIIEMGVTVLHSAPIHAEGICSQLTKPSHDLFKNLRLLFISTATVRSELRKKVFDLVTQNVCVRYSTNESSFVTMTNGENLFMERSVGKPYAGNHVRIVDRAGQVLSVGETGFIHVKTPGMITEYVNDPVNNARYFKDGWFATGDVGRMERDGTLIHLGRGDNMMIFNGINVSPLEIEDCALRNPWVTDAIALPIPHRVHQDVPACVMQLKNEAEVSLSELSQYFRRELGARCPRVLIPAQKIPRNENGKIIKTELIKLVQEWMNKQKQA